jgi:predicted GIY-YIG superfamily endonuclease
MTHSVYVILLEQRIWGNPVFFDENAECDRQKECYYVGMTGLTPEERFAQHRAGIHSGAGWVRRYGLKLVPELYEKLNPMSYEDAVRMEIVLAAELRLRRHGVWQR